MEYYDEVESDCEFVKKSLNFVFNSIFFIILLVFFLVMPLSMAYVGVKNLNECPVEPKIPIYLFVGGLVGLLKLLQTIYDQSLKRRKEKIDQGEDINDIDEYEVGGGGGGDSGNDFSKSSQFINISVSVFLLFWFCLGNYWVFKIWKPNFRQPREHGSHNWCSRNVYMTALYNIGIVYALGGLFFLLTCVLFVIARCRTINQMSADDETDENNAETA